MLRFRSTTKAELPAIEELNKDFGFVFTPGELSLADGVILDNSDNVLAFGIVKPFAEAVFITNRKLPKTTRAKAMDILMKVAVNSSREFGARQLHTIVEDPKLGDSLIKHYDFELVKGIVLVKNL